MKFFLLAVVEVMVDNKFKNLLLAVINLVLEKKIMKIDVTKLQ